MSYRTLCFGFQFVARVTLSTAERYSATARASRSEEGWSCRPAMIMRRRTTNAALTLAAWHGWSGSILMRAINRYRLDVDHSSIVATGHTVFDAGIAKQIRSGIEFNLAFDNLTNRDYYETQNYFESRVTPDAPIMGRIHATPGYPFAAVLGITFHLRGK
jgi:outer membrane receptor protein involved in Fe transport